MPIRAFFRPIAVGNTGFFFALLPLAIRAFFRPIAVGNTGFWRLLPVGQYAAFPGVALRYTPGCVLAPFQGAHSHRPIDNARRGGRLFPLACH